MYFNKNDRGGGWDITTNVNILIDYLHNIIDCNTQRYIYIYIYMLNETISRSSDDIVMIDASHLFLYIVFCR